MLPEVERTLRGTSSGRTGRTDAGASVAPFDALGADAQAALAAAAGAVASPQRVAMLHLLTAPRSVEDLAKALGITRQAVHRHLRKLLDAGMVAVVPGRVVAGRAPKYVVVTRELFALAVRMRALARLHVEAEADPTPPSPLPDLHLTVLDGPEAGRRYPLAEEGRTWTVGRARGSDVRLWHDPFVAPHHAELQRRAHDVVVTDLAGDPGNPTTVDFARATRGAPFETGVGAVLRFGATALVVQRGTTPHQRSG